MGRVHICKGSPSRSEPASRWLPGPKADGREAGVYALSPGHFAPHQHGGLPANSWGGLPGRRPLQPLYRVGQPAKSLPPNHLPIVPSAPSTSRPWAHCVDGGGYPAFALWQKNRDPTTLSTPSSSHPSKSRPQPRAEMGAQKGRSKLPTFRWGARRPRNNGQIKAARAYAQ